MQKFEVLLEFHKEGLFKNLLFKMKGYFKIAFHILSIEFVF